VLGMLLDGGGGTVVTGPFGGGGGGGGHTPDPVSDEAGLVSLASILFAKVSVGRPRGPIQILTFCLYGGLGGVDSCTGMTSTGSTSLSTVAITIMSSSSSSATPSPSPSHNDVNTGCNRVWARAHIVDGARRFPTTLQRVGRI
jgi:hypothetical protein